MPNWKKVIVSGSDAALNSLNVTSLLSVTGSSNLTGSLNISGSVSITGNAGTTTFYTNADTLIFTGSIYISGSIVQTGSLNITSVTSSLFGTASWAQNAITSSHAVNALSASYALTASFALNGGGGGGAITYHQTASAVTWSVPHTLNTYTPIVQVYDDNYNQIIPSSISGSSLTSVQITFSTTTTGYAVLTTGGSVTINISGSNATLVQSTPATTWSFYHGLNETYPVFTIFDNNDDVIVPLRIHAENANTASIYFTTARTGTAVAANCGLSGSTFESASWAATASFAQTTATASYVLNAVSASFAQNASTASYIVLAQTASFVTTAQTASFVTLAQTASYAFNATSASYAATASSAQNASDILVYVKNSSGAQINKGKVVRIVGAVGDNPLIATASYEDDANSANTLGITNETIPNDDFGYVITEGTLLGIDTSAFTAGQLIYLGATGSITGSAPVAPLHAVRLGEVLRVQLNNGSIYVRVDNGYELGELHDVKDTTTTGSYGDLLVKSGSIWINSKQLTGSYGLTGSLNTNGSNTFIGTQTVTGSLFTSGSNTLIGSTTLTGSLNITGSTTQTGNNTLIGNTVLSGSIIISGSTTPGSPTASVQIYGDIRQSGYHRFDPVTTNIDTSISASYIFVSGSTNDLYFSQNGAGYSNVTRLRWLEGNLYTGLLNGGVITAVTGSTTYQISSGSGIIVDLNASLSDDPYPIIQYLRWGNLSASIAPLTASYQQAFVSIDSTGNIYQQGTPYVAGQFDTQINIGIVLFQNQSTINGVKTQPSVAYGFEQSQNIFNRAFGPLKLSGFTLATSGSSTGSLVVGSGTAYSPGSNYTVDPNNPSYAIDSGTQTSKIFRYYQSGSTWVYLTNGGAGFTSIDPTQYSNNGVLTAVPPPANLNWTIQRVFWFPNSVAKAIVVYYGNAYYGSESEAIANINIEPFVEAPNTAANAIYLGAIVIDGNGVFTNAADFTIVPGGLFRSVGGSGGGGSIITTRLVDLSDVMISGPTDGQALVYNTTSTKWENESFISASISGNAATATTATTASYVLNAVSASFASTASYLNPIVSSYVVLTQVSQSLNYVDDADAAANGVPLGGLYRNGNFIAIRIV